MKTGTSLLAAQVAVPNLLAAAEKGTAADARHPLYFTAEAVSRLRRQLTADAALKSQWSALLKRAETLVPAEFVSEEEARQPALRGVALQGRYRSHSAKQLVAMSTTLGLAYRITGEERYAQKLRQALLHYAGYEQWSSPGYAKQTPPRHSDLGTPEFCYGTAVGCEALQDFLSAADRKQIETAMVRLGILPILNDWVLPEKRIHALDSMGHNWWSVIVSGAGVGALALLGADTRAAGWVRAVETALDGFFDYRGQVLQNKPANFDPAGGFYESVGYADYALSTYLSFRLARANAIPEPKPGRIPVLERLPEFFVHTLYPTTGSHFAVNFGDSSLHQSAAHLMRLFAAQGFSPALARWYLQRVEPESSDALALLYLDEAGAAAKNSLPLSVIYPAIGWATLRNSWENDATMLAVKSGDTWNHAHADAGSFILFHAGQPLLIDSGSCSYGDPEYRRYYCQSRAHNVILFNGQGQPGEDFVRAAKFPGHVHSLLDGLGLKYVYADATGPMARYFTRNYRHWLWLDGVILIFDDLLAHEAGRFDWLLHYAGEARRDGADVEVTNGPARARVKMLFPEAPVIREEEGLAEKEPNRKVNYLAFSTSADAREQKFIVAIVPQPPGNAAPPTVELLREPDALGVRVRGQGQITDVYLNLLADGRRTNQNSGNTIAGWETDAYLLALTRPAGSAAATPENVTRYFVSAASYLRCKGQVVFHSLSKVEAAFAPGDNPEVLLEGQQRIEATLLSRQKPARLLVNGKPTLFERQPDQRTVRFRHDAR
ncbi:MAG: heparinase II/III family protein [Burkholderiales bacterium]